MDGGRSREPYAQWRVFGGSSETELCLGQVGNQPVGSRQMVDCADDDPTQLWTLVFLS